MKGNPWILAAVGALLLAAAAARADDGAEKEAQEAARFWLGLVDSGSYAESWKQASSYFKKQVTEEAWVAAVGAVRGPFGKVVSRRLREARYTTALPGAPDGEYVVILFDTSFEAKKTSVERVTPMKDKDGVWRVSGYQIQ
ncbi:MAG TPA: DUF4019 domain-containing protein [Thermoanaerobaculia bacterium]|nr:DUF4019 domain-containing protein [Thermoanaerobaculia bacterium]